MVWAVANSNLALVKYWGKSDEGAKQPAAASLSVTLDSLCTVAGVEFSDTVAEDSVEGLPGGPATRVAAFLEGFRSRFELRCRARVTLRSNFPVAAGLASSASNFAALTKAAAAAAGLDLDDDELADVARLGSGSACRSIHGGFVEWRPEDGRSVVERIASKEHWPLCILVAVTSERPKDVGSSEGMRRTAATSPYYRAWLDSGAEDFAEARQAILNRSLERLGIVAERNCLRMHAAALASVPPLLYWEPATVAVMREVKALRDRGTQAYFSIDAGPQVKVLCEPAMAPAVRAALGSVPGVLRVLESRPGGAARLLDSPPSWAVTRSPAPSAEASAG
ncbi:MAG TPA: diphosphomevalonate decarboxylase [Candidatus Binatia bacterium]|nr:diphosphomevalonate decarboxylase [Candidatus Binatia bacterium]